VNGPESDMFKQLIESQTRKFIKEDDFLHQKNNKKEVIVTDSTTKKFDFIKTNPKDIKKEYQSFKHRKLPEGDIDR